MLNDFIIFYGSEFWAYVMMTIFVLFIVANFMMMGSLLFRVYTDYKKMRRP
jgi:hypothetical protein